MDPSKLNGVLELYGTIEALLNEGQFPGKYAPAVAQCQLVLRNMRSALEVKIKEESNEGNRNPQDAAGVASSASGSGGRKGRKRKGD